MRTVRICMIADDGYVLPTIVTITSIRLHRDPETSVEIRILTPGLSNQNVRRLESLSGKGLVVRVIVTSMERLEGLHKFDSKERCVATTAALLKFLIGELFEDLDRILYLDGDLIVKRDLAELYDVHLDGNIVAAVKDSGLIYWTPKGTEGLKAYFNSGVMVLDLKMMRQGGYAEKLIDAKRRSADMSLMDQNILNRVFDGKVKTLPIKWNCLFVNLLRAYANGQFTTSQLNHFFDCKYKNLADVHDAAAIIHFSSREKPWKFHDAPLVEEWEKVYDEAKLGEIYPLSRVACNEEFVKFPWRTFLGTDKSADDLRADAEELFRNTAACRRKVKQLEKQLREQQMTPSVDLNRGEKAIRVLIVGGDGRGALNPFAYLYAQSLSKSGIAVEGGVRKFRTASPGTYDIVHIQWPESLVGWNLDALGTADIEALRRRFAEHKSAGTKFVYTRHNVRPHVKFSDVTEQLYRLVETESDAVFHMGEYSIQEYSERYGEGKVRNFLIPHHTYASVDREVSSEEARRFLKIPKDDKVLLCFGEFRSKEEVDLVTKVVSNSGIPRLRLLAPRLEGGEGCVGYVPHQALPLYFAAADVVMIQRLHILNSGNLPMAYYFGKVCVGPQDGNVGGLLAATGNPSFDPSDVESAVRALRSGFELAAKGLGERNRKHADENWALPKVTAMAISAYSELLGRPCRKSCNGERDRISKENANLVKRLKSAEEEVRALHASEAYRVGMFLTFPFRRMKRLLCGSKQGAKRKAGK